MTAEELYEVLTRLEREREARFEQQQLQAQARWADRRAASTSIGGESVDVITAASLALSVFVIGLALGRAIGLDQAQELAKAAA